MLKTESEKPKERYNQQYKEDNQRVKSTRSTTFRGSTPDFSTRLSPEVFSTMRCIRKTAGVKSVFPLLHVLPKAIERYLPVIPLVTLSNQTMFAYDQVNRPHRSYRPSGGLPRGGPRTCHRWICLQLSGDRCGGQRRHKNSSYQPVGRWRKVTSSSCLPSTPKTSEKYCIYYGLRPSPIVNFSPNATKTAWYHHHTEAKEMEHDTKGTGQRFPYGSPLDTRAEHK